MPRPKIADRRRGNTRSTTNVAITPAIASTVFYGISVATRLGELKLGAQLAARAGGLGGGPNDSRLRLGVGPRGGAQRDHGDHQKS